MCAARNFRQFHTTFVAKPFKFMTKDGCFFCIFLSTLPSVSCETGQEFKDNGSSRNLEKRNELQFQVPGSLTYEVLPTPARNPSDALVKVLFPGASHQPTSAQLESKCPSPAPFLGFQFLALPDPKDPVIDLIVAPKVIRS